MPRLRFIIKSSKYLKAQPAGWWPAACFTAAVLPQAAVLWWAAAGRLLAGRLWLLGSSTVRQFQINSKNEGEEGEARDFFE